MKKVVAGIVLGFMAIYACGDELVMLGTKKEGTFQGFENGKFLFLPVKGKFMKEQSSRISKIVLPKPTKASYETTDGKKEEDVVFKGYEKGKFMFVKDGKEVGISSLKMKQLDPVFENEGGGGGEGGGAYPIPKVDLTNIGDVSPDQQAILDRFIAAKKTFDEFFTESCAMVQEMDKQKGPKREELLNKLRLRKDQEQPLRKDLVTSYKALRDAFSEPQQEEPVQKPAEKGKPAPKMTGGRKPLSK